MSIEETIDILQGIKDGTACLMKDMPKRGELAIDMAIDSLSEQRWTLCSERLPETDKWRTEYLVTINRGYEDNVKLGTTCMYWENTTVRKKPVSRWIWRDGLSPWEVVAWREMPKPYNGEIE